jgi:cation diffusion facilitator family transporter
MNARNDNPMDMQKAKSKAAAISVASNTFLVLAKVVVGLLIGSVSVISEAIHSGVDLLASIIAYVAVKTSNKPADEDHPFGHGKIENISGTIEALLIFLAAGWIIYEAVHKIFNPQPMESVNIGVLVMAASAAMNFLVSKMLFKVGKATDSMALQADAWHLRTDVWTSAGVMIGLIIIQVGRLLFPSINLHWVDPTAAICVALLIVKAAYDLTVQSGRDLLDAGLAPEEEKWIHNTVIAHSPPVCGFHRLRTRKAGASRFVEFHLLVHGEMTVEDSHNLAEDITSHIQEKYHGTSVTVHVEPCNGYCSKVCLDGCMLDEPMRLERQQLHRRKSSPGL